MLGCRGGEEDKGRKKRERTAILLLPPSLRFVPQFLERAPVAVDLVVTVEQRLLGLQDFPTRKRPTVGSLNDVEETSGEGLSDDEGGGGWGRGWGWRWGWVEDRILEPEIMCQVDLGGAEEERLELRAHSPAEELERAVDGVGN